MKTFRITEPEINHIRTALKVIADGVTVLDKSITEEDADPKTIALIEHAADGVYYLLNEIQRKSPIS
jgi:hypothetical protein